MDRRLTLAFAGLALLAGFAGGAFATLAWFAPAEPPAAHVRPERPARGLASAPKLSNESADPPQRYLSRIAPTPVDSPAPDPAVRAVQAPAQPPNVVVVLGCTVRKDQVSVHGGPPGTTPFLQTMAEQGTVFDDVIAAAPWTRAASTSILTGFYAVSVGMVDPGEGRDLGRLPDRIHTLAEQFKQRGYYTVGATANPNLSEAFGFNQGFDVYQDIEVHQTQGGKANWPKSTGTGIADALLGALKQNRASGDKRPFYMRAMLIDAHSPRNAVGASIDPFREDDVPERVSQYRYHLNVLDGALSHLSRGLAEQGFDEENTVFVFVSDHGEGMNYPRNHGFSHGQYLMPSTNHAVWLLRGPGVASGHRILGLAAQTDVLPTLLGVIGLPLGDPKATEGTDWSALVRGEGRVTTYDHVWTDTWFQEASRAGVYTRQHLCQDDFGSSARQVAKGLFVPGCYDRFADPLLRQPVDDPGWMEPLRAWRAAKTEALPAVQAEQVTINPELAEQLEKLGYRE